MTAAITPGSYVAAANNPAHLVGKVAAMQGDTCYLDYDKRHQGFRKLFHHCGELVPWHPPLQKGDPAALRDAPTDFLGLIARTDGSSAFLKGRKPLRGTGNVVAQYPEIEYAMDSLVRFRLTKPAA